MDRGVEFVLRNIDNAIAFAESKPEFNHLVRILKREKIKLSEVKKTGDLINYFESFASGTHWHALDFYYLEQASKGEIIPSEKLSEYLKNHFKEESLNTTLPSDFIPGEKYSNDFLSVVLGGNYAMSFRMSRNERYSYIMINPFVSNADDHDEGYKHIMFAPPGRFYSEPERLERFF